MLIAGNSISWKSVCVQLRNRNPFKYWVVGEGRFLGRNVKQLKDFCIVIDQSDYANKVKCSEISKKRRKEKDQSITSNELKQFKGVLGAANWILGSTRPDIAAATGLLQQRIGHAQVSDPWDGGEKTRKRKEGCV